MILLGEMRDLETISTALTAAETGHLVFATLHTRGAAGTIDRIIDVFPAEQQGQVRAQLSASLEGVVTQTLLPTADGQGRVAALEILIPDYAVRNLIRQRKLEQIYSVMQTGTTRGMQTMEQALCELVLRGTVIDRGRARGVELSRPAARVARALRRRSARRRPSRCPPPPAYGWQGAEMAKRRDLDLEEGDQLPPEAEGRDADVPQLAAPQVCGRRGGRQETSIWKKEISLPAEAEAGGSRRHRTSRLS